MIIINCLAEIDVCSAANEEGCHGKTLELVCWCLGTGQRIFPSFDSFPSMDINQTSITCDKGFVISSEPLPTVHKV